MSINRPRARCYRTLAELNGHLCLIDSVNMLHFEAFMEELQRLGVTNERAVYGYGRGMELFMVPERGRTGHHPFRTAGTMVSQLGCFQKIR